MRMGVLQIGRDFVIWRVFVVLLRLEPRAAKPVRILGTVRDGCGMEGINVLVWLTPVGAADPIATARTDGDGEFVFPSVAEGEYELHVSSPGLKSVVKQLKTSEVKDLSVKLELPGQFFCRPPPIRLLKSPLPQVLDNPYAGEFADDFGMPIPAGICEIVGTPDRFNGKMVRVRGRIELDFESFRFSTQNCENHAIREIWLEYGSGPPRQPIIWAGDLTPKDPLKVVQNSEFRQFNRDIKARRKGCSESHCNKYEVTATLIGRLDSVPTVLCPNGENQCPENGGLGHFGSSSVRLVIQQVSQVTSKPAH